MFADLNELRSISEYLLYGLSLGLAAGIAPGPLLFLVISETLKGDKLNGTLIAFSPLITDLPIVLISIYGISYFSDTDTVLGLISLFGSLFLVYLGIQNSMSAIPTEVKVLDYKSSLKRGVLTNFFSPHPYVFWISIGAPVFIKANTHGVLSSASFIIGFYFMLIGSKIVIALLSDRSKTFLQSKYYLIVMKISGVAMFVFAVIMLLDGLRYFGWTG